MAKDQTPPMLVSKAWMQKIPFLATPLLSNQTRQQYRDTRTKLKGALPELSSFFTVTFHYSVNYSKQAIVKLKNRGLTSKIRSST